MTPVHERARSFDAWAAEYDRYRPGDPDALFDAVAERLSLPGRPIVDRHAAGRATLDVPYIVDCWTAGRNDA